LRSRARVLISPWSSAISSSRDLIWVSGIAIAST
jgi:hypothetical protein